MSISEKDRSSAQALLEEALEEAAFVESAKKDKRGRALVALCMVSAGIVMSFGSDISSASAAPTDILPEPTAFERVIGPNESLSGNKVSEIAADLNARIAAELGFKDKVFVIDNGLETKEDRLEAVRLIIDNNEDLQNKFDAGIADFYTMDDAAIVAAEKFGRATDNHLPASNEGYLCMASGLDKEMTSEGIQRFLTAAPEHVEFTKFVSPEFAHRMVTAHETGHCLNSVDADISSNHVYNELWNENVADAFGALDALRNGIDPSELGTYADLKDFAIGYMSGEGEHYIATANDSLGHDTSKLLRAMERMAPDLLDQGIKDMSLGELVELSRTIAKSNMPTELEFNDQLEGFNTLKDMMAAANSGEPVPDDVIVNLSDSDVEMMKRYDAAFRAMTGNDSPVSDVVSRATAENPFAGFPSFNVSAVVDLVSEAEPVSFDIDYLDSDHAPGHELAEKNLDQSVENLFGNKPHIAEGVTDYIRAAVHNGIDADTIADLVSSNDTIKGSLPGFSFFGYESEARKAAIDDLKSDITDIANNYNFATEPLRIPDFPEETHGVKITGKTVTVHLLNDDGSLGPMDNPIDAAAVIRGKTDSFYQYGEMLMDDMPYDNPDYVSPSAKPNT